MITVRPPSSLLRGLDDFDSFDLQALRLILRGGSVIDWHRLDLASVDSARDLLRIHEIDLRDPADIAYTERLIAEAVAYLRRQFHFAIPRVVEQSSPEELLLLASGKGHKQLCACTILKAMTIIHHMTCRELLFRLPVSDRDLFHLVEEKVYRVVGAMLSGGFPITEFVGGRKNMDSTYTKLLSKSTSTASNLYDKLRFRIVTRSQDDILPILLYLSENLFPFNYTIPGESTNSLFHFPSYCEGNSRLRRFIPDFQGVVDEAILPGDNRFSAQSYRVIHFVVDVPVRVPDHIMETAPAGCETLGTVVQVPCEFQMLDAQTDASNEIGDASHDAYKQRQREAVSRRLRLGARLEEPPSPDDDEPSELH